MAKKSALIVDDEPDIRELLEITLGRMGIDTLSAPDIGTARNLLESHSFDFCLTDMNLPDGNGIDLVQHINTNYPSTPVAMITAHGNMESAVEALKAGAFDFVSKPVNLQLLRNLVDTALNLQPLDIKTDTDTDLLGNTPIMQALRKQIAKLARSQAPIYIKGESGSGKELVARSIHAQGPRRENDFIAINCGAIPSELMESEFFGHRKGSFTGAHSDKTGLFQAANGGSLFLDEIADLPLHMQVKLLRAIQEKSVRPVGSETEIPVDVRLISATHKNLANEVDQGNVRQDLYYRINVIELHVPALRERKGDIPLLANHFLELLANEQTQGKVTLNEEAINKLQAYDFPGNVRELENILQRSLALAEDNLIRAEDLPPLTPQIIDESPSATIEAQELIASGGEFSLEKHLEKIEKAAIEKALEETRWNKTAAAKKLGMSFRSFRYRLKKLGVD